MMLPFIITFSLVIAWWEIYLRVVIIRDARVIIRDKIIINWFIRRVSGVHDNVLEIKTFQNNKLLKRLR